MPTGVTTGMTGVEWVISGGGIILLVGVVLALVTGRLIPRKTHETQLNGVKEVSDMWKTASEDYKKTLAVLTPAVEKLVKYAETTDAVLTGLRQAVDEIARKERAEGNG